MLSRPAPMSVWATLTINEITVFNPLSGTEILRADLIITLVKINRSACRHRHTRHSSRPFLRIHHSAICYQLHLSAGRRRHAFNGIPGNKIRRYRYDVEVDETSSASISSLQIKLVLLSRLLHNSRWRHRTGLRPSIYSTPERRSWTCLRWQNCLLLITSNGTRRRWLTDNLLKRRPWLLQLTGSLCSRRFERYANQAPPPIIEPVHFESNGSRWCLTHNSPGKYWFY